MINYDNILSDVVKNTKPSGIRKFFDIAASVDDAISLSIGEPDFITPWPIRRAAVTALEKGKTTYTANAGLSDLRNKLSDTAFITKVNAFFLFFAFYS